MRILIVSYVYWPWINPRALRWTRVAEGLATRGHRVEAVCAWKAPLPREEARRGVAIRRAGYRWREAIARLRRAVPPPAGEGAGKARSATPAGGPPGRGLADEILDRTWRRVYWPDHAGVWCLPAAQASASFARAGGPAGLVSVSYPFSSHLVGWRLKRLHPRLRWIVDIGDPFCFAEDTPQNNFALYRGFNRRIERMVFAAADGVSVTNGETARRYGRLFPESAGKIRVIPPILSWQPGGSARPVFEGDEGCLNLVFVGTLYRDIRNPAYLLQLLEAMRRSPLGGRIRLHVFGNLNDCPAFFERGRGLPPGTVRLHGVVPQERAQEAMRAATALVNIGNLTPYHLPSKVVEYAAAGRPILNLVHGAEDSSALFFRGFPSPILNLPVSPSPSSRDVEAAVDLLTRPAAPVPAPALEAWLRPFTEDAVVSAYEEMLGPRRDA